MPKEKTLEKLYEAKKSHIIWLNKAKHIVSHSPTEIDTIPLNSTECNFGCWLYNDGMVFLSIKNLSEVLQNIESTHVELHDAYLNIHEIYFQDRYRKGISQLFLGRYKEISLSRKKEALEHYEDLRSISNKLIMLLNVFETELLKIDNSLLYELAH